MQDNKELEDRAWGMMLERLDDEMPERKAIVWRRYLTLLLFLLVATTGGLLWHAQSDSSVSSELNENSTQLSATRSVDEDHSTHLTEEQNTDSYLEYQIQTNTSTSRTFVEQKLPVDKSANPSNSETKSTYLTSNQESKKPYITGVGVSTTTTTTNSVSAIATKNKMIAMNRENLLTKTSAETRNNLVPNIEFLYSQSATKTIAKKQVKEQEHSTIESQKSLSALAINEALLPAIAPPSRVSSERIVRTFLATELSYLTDIEQLSARWSILSEVGSTQSPWSFTTGISYQRIVFQSLSFQSLDRAFEPAVGDTTKEDLTTFPTTQDQLDREIGSLRYVDYIGIPLHFNYRMNRFQLSVGIENNFAVKKNFSNGNDLYQNSVLNDRVFNYQLNFVQEINYNLTNKFQLGLRTRFDLTGAHNYNSDYNRMVNQFGLQLKYQIR